jgi:small-conductance mechanosensitive channel
VMGDRVKIGDNIGDVIEKTLLSTRIRTIKNEDITIPNSIILGGSIINYSNCATEAGLILNTKITIGYDVPWPTVHRLLVCAALRTPDILAVPMPFVLQTSLDDFSVAYEINAYTRRPNSMAQIYSNLHGNIQDVFNEEQVEIMSPHYTGIRDGNQSTIPHDFLSAKYVVPSFGIKVNEAEKNSPRKRKYRN